MAPHKRPGETRIVSRVLGGAQTLRRAQVCQPSWSCCGCPPLVAASSQAFEFAPGGEGSSPALHGTARHVEGSGCTGPDCTAHASSRRSGCETSASTACRCPSRSRRVVDVVGRILLASAEPCFDRPQLRAASSSGPGERAEFASVKKGFWFVHVSRKPANMSSRCKLRMFQEFETYTCGARPCLSGVVAALAGCCCFC
jgi:hypothetical protein